MGAGKSYFAKQLQKELNLNLIDLDIYIETIANKTIPEIFESGESHFRMLETEALKQAINNQSVIISTGGGAPCFNNNIETMLKNGIVIWLNPPVSTIAARLLHETAHRPLLKNAKKADDIEIILSDLLKKREVYYKQAHLHITSDEPNMKEIVSYIRRKGNE